MLTYELVSSASRRGLFLVLHPNIALSELAYVRATCFVKAKFNNWGRGKNVKFS